MSGNEAFEMVVERGWSRGLNNLWRSGVAGWFKTKMWWVQSLIWGGMVGLLMATMLFGQGSSDPQAASIIMAIFAGLMPAIAVVIIMQDAVVGEKKEGTAAWVLSKPVTRSSFIISKLLANSLGVFVSMVVVPFGIAYVLLWIANGVPNDVARFLGMMGAAFLSHLYFLTLTLMLGTLFDNRGPVIGLGLAFLFLQQYLLGALPFLRYVLPWTLSAPIKSDNDSVIITLLSGGALQTQQMVMIVCVAIQCALFVWIGLWRFNKQEL